MTGITYLLSLTFSIQDYAKLANTRTGLPLAEIFRQATQSVGGAFALTFILWVAIGPCMVGSQLSMRLSTFWYLHTMRYLMRFCFFRYRSSLLGFRQRWGSAAVKSVRPAQAVGKLFFQESIILILSTSWSKVNRKLGVPFNAQFCVTAIIALLGCIYLGSSTAFNAMMSSAVLVHTYQHNYHSHMKTIIRTDTPAERSTTSHILSRS